MLRLKLVTWSMNSENSQNSVSTNEKCMFMDRKRKRRKWKKCVSSINDSSYPARSFKNENACSWITGPTWYWSNYQKALEWQNKIKNMEHAVHSVPRGTCFMTNDFKNDMEMEQESYENGEIEIEMSEEMKKFFEESIKHKMKMRRLKEKEKEEEEEEEEYDCINSKVKEIMDTHNEREKEMKLLYGDGSSMIIGMETAVQLSFDKYCDLKSPKYWPNIPLKL